ncbi:MAG TPA: hypothetical protein VFN80_00880 [Acidothermaceae bacterium]|jgi:hypothetical protein|nr:hypothetical protein [Acidothermaceae bacterium]
MACTVFGHRYRFTAQGATMRWECQRGCGAGGHKQYGSEADARRYAQGLDVEDDAEVGRRAPLLGMFPLRVYRALRNRRS